MPSPARMATCAALGAVAACTIDALVRPRYSFRGKTVIITGGSRGLGLAMARRLAGEGASLALLARDDEELQRAVNELQERGADGVIGIVCDVADRDQVDAAVRTVVDEFGAIDVLINNAGNIQVGPLDVQTERDIDAALALYVYAPYYTSMAVRPHMRANSHAVREPHGRIVNIASIGGLVSVPHLLPYSIGKHGQVGLSDALHRELRHEGILVTTVCPGLMRTGSPPHVEVKGRHKIEYALFKTSDSMPGVTVAADSAARRILNACREGRARLTFPLNAKLAALMEEIAPNAAAALYSATAAVLPKSGSPEIRLGRESESALSRNPIAKRTDRVDLTNVGGGDRPAAIAERG